MGQVRFAPERKPREWFVVCYDGNRFARGYRQHNDKT